MIIKRLLNQRNVISGILRSPSTLCNIQNRNLIIKTSKILTKNVAINLTEIKRNKYDSKHPKKSKQNLEDEELSDDDDDFDQLIGDKSTKTVKTSVNSLRADLLLRAGLGIARNKIELAFYENKIRVNGKKLQKKSTNCSVGDEIDLIKGESTTNSNHLVVGRIEILSAVPEDESIKVILKRYKSLLIEKYDD